MDSPACSVTQAKPKVISRIFNMNNSSLSRRSTTRNQTRMAFWPPHNSSPTNTDAFSKASDNSVNTLDSFI